MSNKKIMSRIIKWMIYAIALLFTFYSGYKCYIAYRLYSQVKKQNSTNASNYYGRWYSTEYLLSDANPTFKEKNKEMTVDTWLSINLVVEVFLFTVPPNENFKDYVLLMLSEDEQN